MKKYFSSVFLVLVFITKISHGLEITIAHSGKEYWKKPRSFGMKNLTFSKSKKELLMVNVKINNDSKEIDSVIWDCPPEKVWQSDSEFVKVGPAICEPYRGPVARKLKPGENIEDGIPISIAENYKGGNLKFRLGFRDHPNVWSNPIKIKVVE